MRGVLVLALLVLTGHFEAVQGATALGVSKGQTAADKMCACQEGQQRLAGFVSMVETSSVFRTVADTVAKHRGLVDKLQNTRLSNALLPVVQALPLQTLQSFGRPTGTLVTALSLDEDVGEAGDSTVAFVEFALRPTDCIVFSVVATLTILMVLYCTFTWATHTFGGAALADNAVQFVVPVVMGLLEAFVLKSAFDYGRAT